jgi:hypothetical protein
MAKQEPKRSGFDGSWAAWKDRLGIIGVVLALLLLLFFMFTDASLNFQCSVTDFIMMKCNRLNREFKPWDQLDKQQPKSSSAPSIEYRSGKAEEILFPARVRA